jgi:hypothetical protein
MAGISLPPFPKGEELEEFVSAYFQAAGFYIERRIIDRQDKEEILELDIIVTKYDEGAPSSELIEVKSGDWGFSDLFKIRGWLDYLKIPHGVLITSNQKDKLEQYKKVSSQLDISLRVIEETTSPTAANDILGYSPFINIRREDLINWRFSYWIERTLLGLLKKRKKKTYKTEKRHVAIDTYYHDVNSGLFLIENRLARIEKLYTAYNTHPNISARTATEMIGGNFDDEVDGIPSKVFTSTFQKYELNDIQISCFVEHRARLALLKNTIDFILFKNNGHQELCEENIDLKFDDQKFSISRLNFLPESFSLGLQTISSRPYFPKLPVFWQTFMFLFGGFILLDRKDEEYEALSLRTDIPPDKIEEALGTYDLLFPSNGWFKDLTPRSHIRIMKLFPTPFMGLGANFRRHLYECKDLKKLNLSGQYTTKDLISWGNCGLKMLTNAT